MKISDIFSSKAIDDVVYLGQIFYLVLFFECFNLITQNQSIINSGICLESITLKPFFFYFIFLGILRVFWFFTAWIISILMSSKTEISEISVRSSFTVFLVFVSLIVYSIIIFENPTFVPIRDNNHWILIRIYQGVFSLGAIFMFLIFLNTTPYFEGKNKK